MSAGEQESLQVLVKRGEDRLLVILESIEENKKILSRFKEEEYELKLKIENTFAKILRTVEARKEFCFHKIDLVYQPTFNRLESTITYLSDQMITLEKVCEDAKQSRTISYNVETIETEIQRIHNEVQQRRKTFNSILSDNTVLGSIQLPTIKFSIHSQVDHVLQHLGSITQELPIERKKIGQKLKEVALESVYSMDSRTLSLAIFKPGSMQIRKGKIYVINEYDKSVCIISNQGKLLSAFSFAKYVPDDDSQQDLAVNDNFLFISVWKKDCIIAFGHGGMFYKEVIKLTPGIEFKSPYSMCVTSAQQLVIADRKNKRVLVCHPDLNGAQCVIMNPNIKLIIHLTVTREDNILLANDCREGLKPIEFQLYNLTGQLLCIMQPSTQHVIQGLAVSFLKHIILSCGSGNSIFIYNTTQSHVLQIPLAKATCVRYMSEKYLFVSCINRILVYDLEHLMQ
ncbi:hypothetical protein LOD99_188 [Oopsacas minuta]|uniref:Uncharacterized protein n=1 Tax=Oopsacas minuta TaxID=111878 RepID=A0AAV7K7Z6_9METZ|nr:hypothetical protein LOD99_188 [Oopsacas minuta]